MVARPLSRLRLATPERTSAPADGDVIDLRDRRGPMRKKAHGNGPRRVEPAELERSAQLRETRFFGSPAFRRLWISQLLSSLGDWIGLVAITALSFSIAGAGGFSLVIAIRLGLAFVFASFAGVIVDRVNRKKVMVLSDIGRCIVFFALPFVSSLWQLVIAALLLEVLTLLWAPAKEASVPNLVKPSFLPTANSLSLVAAYGPFPFAGALYALLAKAPEWFGQSEYLRSLDLTADSVALYFDGLTYLASALVIATLALPHNSRRAEGDAPVARSKRQVIREGVDDAREGLAYVTKDAKVRAVVFGLGAALMGGGSLVPLGLIFVEDVLHAGSGGYGLLFSALGTGLAVGIVAVTVLQKKLDVDRVFVLAICVAGFALLFAAGMNGLAAAAFCMAVVGLCSGAVYVLGFTSLQTNVDDAIRGRVFATFYTVTRVCLLLAITVSPLISSGLNRLSNDWVNGSIDLMGRQFALPGVRLTLWLSAVIIIAAGLFALKSLRRSMERVPSDG